LNPSGIVPLDVKVLVLPDPVEEKTAGGIIKPSTTADKEKYAATRGKLVAKGPNAFKEWGSDSEPGIGGRVLYAQYAGARFEGDDGADYIVMNDEDVIGEVAA
jgi:chaperonin GroES